MQYLLNRIKASKAHIWDGEDTVCRMWGTGGLLQSAYEVVSEPGAKGVCSMCQSMHAGQETKVKPYSFVEYAKDCATAHTELSGLLDEITAALREDPSHAQDKVLGLLARQRQLMEFIEGLDLQVAKWAKPEGA